MICSRCNGRGWLDIPEGDPDCLPGTRRVRYCECVVSHSLGASTLIEAPAAVPSDGTE